MKYYFTYYKEIINENNIFVNINSSFWRKYNDEKFNFLCEKSE